ncbi:hypothetical protein HPP92_015762 [Vanilla planifolia]|uniref:Uncharacterized protein n=1 Tax=Vanilla planifolia TaxID=51239 RepID=A0A835UVE7_VANPL|nr:hypothetical protein HPP92_015762 [Vanilla planifolia]
MVQPALPAEPLPLPQQSLRGYPARAPHPAVGGGGQSRNRLTGDPSVLFASAKPTTRNLFEFDLTRDSFPVNLTLLDLNHNVIIGWVDTCTVEPGYRLG